MTKRGFLNFIRFDILVLLLVAIVFTVLLVMEGQKFERTKAFADVQLYMTAGSNQLVTSKTVEVILDTRGKKVSFVDVTIKFDPNTIALNPAGITTTDKLKNVVVKSTPAQAAKGIIRITVAARPEDMAVLPLDVFEVARFVVDKKPTVTGNNLSTTMTFDTNAMQVVDSTARNLSLETPPLVLTVNPSGSAAPTVAPTAVPTIAPTRTPTATPAATKYKVMFKNIPSPDTVADLFELNYVKIGTSTYQEDDSKFEYVGTWKDNSTFTTKYTVNTATVTFESLEPIITLGTSKGSGRGTVQVWVNDQLKKTIVLTQATGTPYEVQINLR